MIRRTLPFAAAIAAFALIAAGLFAPPVIAQESSQTLQYNQVRDNSQERDYSHVRIVRLSLVLGDVQVLRPEEEGWQAAQLNLPVRHGYEFATFQGRAEFEFESGATARIAENSILRMTELALLDGGRITELTLQQGTATFYAKLASQDRFIVRTPHLLVQIPENARFRLDVTPDGTSVGVLKGEVTVEALGAGYRLTKNRALHFRGATDQILLAKLGEADEWDRWVADREEVLVAARDRSSRYVRSAGYVYGIADLDYYGNWYNVAGYGWGWRPYGVSVGWIPYSRGYWHYMAGLHWSWFSYEPWGWMPYHFGSWICTPRHGWMWVPGHFNYWSPARVYYVWNNNRLGWGPLHPHDRPGQRPANLPHGQVTPLPGPPAGYRGAPRLTRADLGPQPGTKVFYERPEGFDDVVRVPKGAARAGGAPATPGAPAAGYSGTNRAPAGRMLPEDRGETPARGRAVDGAPQGGIVYDPESRRYVNNPNPGVPGRTAREPREANDVRPPSPRGYSGAAPAPAQPNTPIPPPAVERRGYDRDPETPRQAAPSSGYGGAVNPRPTPRTDAPRYESPRTESPRNTPQPQPRYESPRYESSPRNEAPRPTPQPRYESPRNDSPRYESTRPSSPPPRSESPRYESPRPSSPPPRMESPRYEAPRPSSPPPRMESPRTESPRQSSPPPPPPRPNKPGGQ